MKITNEAKTSLEKILMDHAAGGIRIFFAGFS
jgi:hypothetical protein